MFKRLKLAFVALLGLLASCVTGEIETNPPAPPAEEVDPFLVSLDDALDEMHSLMDALYGPGTRAAERKIANVETLTGSRLGGKTRSGAQLPENLAYLVNFENDGGFAVLGANINAESVYCITEAGNFTMEDVDRIWAEITSTAATRATDIGTAGSGGAEEAYPPSLIDAKIALYYVLIAIIESMERDVDGDGIPDHLDPDTDNDGILDMEDPDIDGDGVPNADDPDCKLKWEEVAIEYEEEENNGYYPMPSNMDEPGIPINSNGTSEYPKVGYTTGPWENRATDILGPYVTTKWNQGNPYNMWCPWDSKKNERSDAGCVAIAMAQIIAANEKPAPSKICSGVTMSWAQLKARNYNVGYGGYSGPAPQPNSAGYEEANQLARIIWGIGNSVDTDYSADGSDATDRNAKRYFDDIGYKSVSLVNKYDDGDIQYMLRGGRPVYISARQVGEDVGHAWVIDGVASQRRQVTKHVTLLVSGSSGGYTTKTSTSVSYETRDLLHCNFGWGGDYNGYYISEIFDTRTGPEVDDDNNEDSDEKDGGLYKKDFTMILYKL